MKTTKFQVGPNPERDTVAVETLLMKLGMAQAVFQQQTDFVAATEANGGQAPGDHLPPDQWAVTGAINALMDVSHALECGCFGWPVSCDQKLERS